METLVSYTIISLLLPASDFDSVQLLSNLGTTEQNTFIAVTNETILDTSDNALLPINTSLALQVARIVGDQTRPQLLSFSLDVNTGVLVLNFPEVVDANTLNITSFEFVNSQAPTARYRLTLITMVPLSNTTLDIQLGDFDLNNIKQDTNLAVNLATTFLTVTSSAITDAAGNPIVDITDSGALRPVSIYLIPLLLHWLHSHWIWNASNPHPHLLRSCDQLNPADKSNHTDRWWFSDVHS